MTTIAVGTEKGAYLLRPDGDGWAVTGPLLPGWKVTAFGRAPDGRVLAAVASNWFGVSVHVSEDLETFEEAGAPTWPDAVAAERKLEAVWTFSTVGDTVYAGVADAGLFRSTDLKTWEPVDGLNEHDARLGWQPGMGGLCAHHVLAIDGRMYVGISSVGVFHSDDGADTFTRRDAGVVNALSTEDGAEADGWCVHAITVDPADPDRLWRQDHAGVYRTSDGGQHWERIDASLPNEKGFGFPILRDHETGRLFVAPLHSDESRVPVDGKLALWSSDDDGDSWHVAGTGWSDDPTFTGVLRGALASDQQGTIAAGTTAGKVWASPDRGDSWAELPATFPRIGAVAVWSDL